MYDLERPDAPVFLSQDGDDESGKGSEQLAHDGLIKSVVWRDQGMREIASAADDGTFRWVSHVGRKRFYTERCSSSLVRMVDTDSGTLARGGRRGR